MTAKKGVRSADEMSVDDSGEMPVEVEMTFDPSEEEDIPTETVKVLEPVPEPASELQDWVEASKRADAARVEAEKLEPQAAIVESIEEKIAGQYPDSYRVTQWAGHSNYECNKCGFADLDKFKLYAHLIQAHSGIEYDYRGETTHN